MPDVAIQPAGSIDYRGMAGKLVPSYLISVEYKKQEIYYIVTKYDETSNFIKFVGFLCNLPEGEIIAKYDEIIKTTDPSNFVEKSIPVHRIVSVRSLIYKHKSTTGERK